MKKTLQLLSFIFFISQITFSQLQQLDVFEYTKQLEALEYINTFRGYYSAEPLIMDKNLHTKAYNWAKIISDKGELQTEDDEIGENLYSIANDVDITRNNIYLDAVVAWIIVDCSKEDKELLLDNLLDKDARKAGFAFSKNASETFVVFKYE